MRTLNLLILSALALLLAGCVTPSTYDFSQYHEEKPRSILVLPVVNNSVDVLAPTSVLTTLPRVLAEKGYYVFPVNTVKTLLEYEGLYEPSEIHQLPTKELSSLFGADAVLYLTIHEWTSKYAVFATTTVVDFEYTIANKQGEQLWNTRKKLTYSPQNNNNSGSAMAMLISAAVTAAVERAAPNYLPLTRQANYEVFYTDYTRIPPGPYLPGYDEYYTAIESAGTETSQNNTEANLTAGDH